jgi:hypothetical protein
LEAQEKRIIAEKIEGKDDKNKEKDKEEGSNKEEGFFLMP